MGLYDSILRPALFQVDPESAHHFSLGALRRLPPGWLKTLFGAAPRCERQVFGLTFPNPIGLAAGFDKNAHALPAWEAIGFGFVEAGTITAQPQPGNPRPRIFRVPQKQALINRLGFNNDGADIVASRLRILKEAGKWPPIPIGINIGKSKVTPLDRATEDYVYSFQRLFAHGDYFVLNVSSPNTPGLRALQDRGALDELLGAAQAKNRELSADRAPKPLLVKIAPDLEFAQIDEILQLALDHQLAGIVATNTTIDHSSLADDEQREGGLSGAPLRARATEIVRYIAGKTSLPVIAVGGIMNAEAAREKFEAGAALVQLYTGFVYRGPALIREICREIASLVAVR